MTLKLSVLASIAGYVTKDSDLSSAKAPLKLNKNIEFLTGVAAGKANLVFADTRTLAASATEDLDLAGSLTDLFGAVLTFARIKAILVAAAAANTNDVVVGGTGSNQFVGPFGAATHTQKVSPGGVLLLANPSAAGWPVTASTADLLKVANSAAGTSVTYDIVIVGAAT